MIMLHDWIWSLYFWWWNNSLPHSLKASHLSHASSYLGYKNESQDKGGANEESSAEESRKCIDKILQGVGSDDNDCEYNAGHISGCCDILGIIKALDLHLANWEGKNKGNDLQHHLVTIQDAQEYVSGYGITDKYKVVSDNTKILGEGKRISGTEEDLEEEIVSKLAVIGHVF